MEGVPGSAKFLGLPEGVPGASFQTGRTFSSKKTLLWMAVQDQKNTHDATTVSSGPFQSQQNRGCAMLGVQSIQIL